MPSPTRNWTELFHSRPPEGAESKKSRRLKGLGPSVETRASKHINNCAEIRPPLSPLTLLPPLDQGVFFTIMGPQLGDQANNFDALVKGHFGTLVSALWTSSRILIRFNLSMTSSNNIFGFLWRHFRSKLHYWTITTLKFTIDTLVSLMLGICRVRRVTILQ